MGTIPGHQRIAQRRIVELFFQAELRFASRPELSRRYIAIARAIASKYRIRLSAGQKRSFCKKCNSLLRSGITLRSRLEKGKLVMTCLNCGSIRRMVYK